MKLKLELKLGAADLSRPDRIGKAAAGANYKT